MTSNNYVSVDQNFIDLRNGIIKQAVADWKAAKKVEARLKDKRTLEQERKYNAAVCRLAELEVFFKGRWVKQLCGEVDPMKIFYRLKYGRL